MTASDNECVNQPGQLGSLSVPQAGLIVAVWANMYIFTKRDRKPYGYWSLKFSGHTVIPHHFL